MPHAISPTTARPRRTALAALRRDAWREALACIAAAGRAGGAVTAPGRARAVVPAQGAGRVRGWPSRSCCAALPAHAPNARFGAGQPRDAGAPGARSRCWRPASASRCRCRGDAPGAPSSWRTDGRAARCRSTARWRARPAWPANSARASTWRRDALLVLVLCLLVFQFDKAGAWILAAGLMRYALRAGRRGPGPGWRGRCRRASAARRCAWRRSPA